MKKCTLAIVATFFLCIGYAVSSYAQDNCEEVKKENEALKKALKMLEPEKSQTVDNTEIRLVKTVGDAKSQTILLEFILVNKQANKEVTLSRPEGIDLEGNQYDTNHEGFKIGGKYNKDVINTDVPIKATVSLKKTLPAVKYLKLFKFNYRSENTKYPDIDIEFRDIQISWK